MSALINGFGGDFAVAIPRAERAPRLSPFDPGASSAHCVFGFAQLFEARDSEAAAHFAKPVQANPQFRTFIFNLAIALALAVQVEEARPIARRGLELEPGFRIAPIVAFGLAPEIADRLAEGARLLGLPE